MNQATLRDLVMEAIGEASLCWTPRPSGVFDTDQAIVIGEQLISEVNNLEVHNRKIVVSPSLGVATTRQLLEELKTRIEIDYHSGGGGLDYTPINGRPERSVDAKR